MIKVYLASQFRRQLELRTYAEELESARIAVVSTWLYEEGSDSDTDNFEKYAETDLFDIEQCDIFVHFTGGPYGTDLAAAARGGRHVESGYAIGLDKECVLVGPRENIFHYTNRFAVIENWNKAFKYLLESR